MHGGLRANYSYYPLVFDGYKKTRDQVFEELKTHNIFARKYFYPLTSTFNCYKDRYNADQTPAAKHIAERVLTLPLYPDLNIGDIDRICQIIKN